VSDGEILEKLLEFGEYLSKGTIFIDVFRTVGWYFVLGLAWVIDGLENITDSMLGLKLFYDHPEFVEFVEQFQPVFVILFAFNILFIGYLLIFNKQFNRAGVFTNVVMALIIVVLLGSGMSQADRFTTDAIDAINYDGEEKSTLASTIIKDHITDISLFDLNGWETTDLEQKNRIRPHFARDININSYLTEGSDVIADRELSPNGEKILGHKIETLGDGSRAVVELESGNWITDITQEYYYRYTISWINMLGTLLVVGLVLITVSVKLAKLFFELAFNYVLAGFIAPSDMHSGQRIKQVVQNILNIFLVTIMIFLSLKVYLIGTDFIGQNLEGIPYLIAMIGFALAVIDGPNIVERLFGIDAGVKSGWSALAGSYAAAKGATSLGKGMGKGALAAAKGAGAVASKSASATSGVAGAVGGMMGKGEQAAQGKGGDAANKANAAENGKKANVQGQGKGQGAADKTGKGGSTGQGTAEGTQNGEHANSIHDEMAKANANKNAENEQGSNRPTSLHDEMNSRGCAGTNASKSGTISGSKTGGTASGNVGNKTTGPPKTVSVSSQNASPSGAASRGAGNTAGLPKSASVSDQIAQGTSQVAATNDSEYGHATEGTETVSVTDQKSGGATNGKTTTSGGTANGTTTSEGASGVAGSAPRTRGAASGTSGSVGSKTSSVKNSQRGSGAAGSFGKEIIEEQNEVTNDFSNGGTIEQEIRSSTSDRQGSSGSNATVRQTTSGTGTPGAASQVAASGASGVAGSAPRTRGAASGTSGSVGSKTSSVKSSQRGSSNAGSFGKEMIEEQTEMINDASGGGTIEQERRVSTNHRQGSSGSNPSVRQTTSSGGGSSTSGGTSGGTTAGVNISGGSSSGTGSTSRAGGTSGGSSGSGGTKTSAVSHTTHAINDIDSSTREKEVIQENNEVIQEDRHIGQIIRDTVSQSFNSTKTVKNTKRSYQVGRNTGQAIKRNFKKNFTRKK
jgi:hypothetical protein